MPLAFVTEALNAKWIIFLSYGAGLGIIFLRFTVLASKMAEAGYDQRVSDLHRDNRVGLYVFTRSHLV